MIHAGRMAANRLRRILTNISLKRLRPFLALSALHIEPANVNPTPQNAAFSKVGPLPREQDCNCAGTNQIKRTHAARSATSNPHAAEVD